MGAMSVNPLFQAQQQQQQPASSGGMGSLPPAMGASQAPYDPFAASPQPQQRGGGNPLHAEELILQATKEIVWNRRSPFITLT